MEQKIKDNTEAELGFGIRLLERIRGIGNATMPKEKEIEDKTEAELGFGIRALAGETALLVALAVPVFYFTLG